MMDKADAFWAAKQVAAFTDDEIRAIVETGKLSDQRAADWIADCLIKRRDKIAQAWFSKMLALDRFHVADGRLAFEDLSASYENGAPKSYEWHWSSYENDHDVLTPLSNASGTKCPQMRGDGYWVAAVTSPAHPLQAVRVYVRKHRDSTEIVGVERTW
jgi:hypothetical protein